MQALLYSLLAVPPYAMYSFFLNIERNPEEAKRAYRGVTAGDIEEMTRCAPERCYNLISIAKEKRKKSVGF